MNTLITVDHALKIIDRFAAGQKKVFTKLRNEFPNDPPDLARLRSETIDQQEAAFFNYIHRLKRMFREVTK